MNNKHNRHFIEIKKEVREALSKRRLHRRETWNDILARLLGLTGREEKQTQTQEAGDRELSASSNSEGSA